MIFYKYYTLLWSLLAVACNQKAPLFQQLTEKETGINFINKVRDSDSLNILVYPYLFNGAGVAIGDINNDGWEDIFFVGNQKGSNKLYLNKGGFAFADISGKAGVKGKSDWCTGVTMVDINGDGWLDIYVSTVTIPGKLNSANELYINNKDGTFTEAAEKYGLDFKGHTTQTVFFDYDHDGDLDCFILNHAVTYADDYKTIEARNETDPASGDKLLQNNNGRFTDVTAKAGIYSSSIGYGLGIAVGDINNDGWPDIYVSNDFKENDYCYINNGNGTFTEKSGELFGHMSRFSMGNDMADINNDGWLDIITLDMLSPDEKILKASVADDDIGVYNYKHHFGFHYQFSRNCLQQNVGGKYFSDIGLQKGIAATDWSWAPLLADFDNDGYKDLYISNGFTYRLNDLDFNNFMQGTIIKNQQQHIPVSKYKLLKQIPGGAVPDYFYLNTKEHGFQDLSKEAGFVRPTLSNGAAYADLDKDGRLDLVVNRINEPAGIYKNNMPVKHYLNLRLVGNNGNTSGIGADIYIYTGNGLQRYYQSPVRGFMSSVSYMLHVGLGDNKVIDSLFIIWPGGKTQRLTGTAIDSTLELKEENASSNYRMPDSKRYLSGNWKERADSLGVHFIHKEDAFDDLNVQPFLPHSLATQGPKIAIGDVNGDGLEDFYVCGARNQSGELYIQNSSSSFTVSLQKTFLKDSVYEDTDAIFFDADGDGDQDLYVTSGGNEFYGHNELLKDRLYINDGKGNFHRSNTLPDLYENKSCVRACDFDKDGDLDLFVGGRANARMYGYTPASVLLQNDGKGNFSEVTEKLSGQLFNVGMVTDACWTDIDKDGWMDLIVVGEWMPVTVFKNEKGRLVKQDIGALKNATGWWNCIYPVGIDNDGHEGYLLGNWGTNTKLTASQKYPLRMYLADWDGKGEMDPVLAIHKNDNYYTFQGKTDLEKRLPFLKKRFLKYGEAAGKTINEILGKDNILRARQFEAATLQSSILWNDGGQLSLQALPDFLQVAPIFSFASFKNEKGEKDFIAGGNFYEVAPYEGRYDAMLPTIFTMQRKKVFLKEYICQKGAVRNVQPITVRGYETALLIGNNNDRLMLITKSSGK